MVVLGGAVLEHDVVAALRAGADDFVRKPVSEDEFVARIAAQIRRHRRPAPAVIEIGHLIIDVQMKEVMAAGNLVRLIPIEYQIVELLVQDIGVVIQRETIATLVWGRPIDEAVSRSLDMHIYRIRRKLRLHALSGLVLRSAYTLGYRLEYVSREPSRRTHVDAHDRVDGRIAS